MKKKITKITFKEDGYRNIIIATFDDGSTDEICSYYPDELSFCESEFLGLTREEAMDLKTRKDIAYLRS